MENGVSEAQANLLLQDVKKVVIVRQQSKKTPVLSVVDILLSIFIVTPLVVFTWRGSWGFMDIHTSYFPPLPTFVLGMTIHIILAMCQDSLHDCIIESEKHWTLKIVSHFLRRFYTYIFLTITIFHWRGGWTLLDYFTNVQITENFVAKKDGSLYLLLIWGACFLTLVAMKGLRNAIAPPFAICIDKGNYVFKFPTMFKSKSHKSALYHLLDCMFSVGIVGNLVVFFWRGMWVITDILLLPNDFLWSSWSSLILGALVVGAVFRLQSSMKRLCTTFSGITKVLIADFYIVLSIIATILYWRGSWNLLYIYFLPNDVNLSCILTHVIGFTSLVVLGCSNSMLVRGVYKDGKEPNGQCVVFPCQYLRIIMEEENLNFCDNSENHFIQNVSNINNDTFKV